jgi:hypothetical protein
MLPTKDEQIQALKDALEKHGKHSPPLSSAIGGQLNPMWVEWLMGFPLGWTDLEDSETP